MSSKNIAALSRKLDKFEENVYQISQRLAINNSEEFWDFDPKACNLRFESATQGPPAQVSYLLSVIAKQCNMLGNLHGGCAATMIDILSSMILIGVSRPGVFSQGGVSRNLGVTYLRPVPVDTEIRVVSKIVHMGRRLALLRSEIYRVDTGDLCVVSDHEKANTDPEVNGKI